MTERELFMAALDRASPADRAAYLDAACAGDPPLRERVEALLRSHEGAGGFLAGSAPERLAGAQAGSGADETRTGPSGPDAEVPLDFLAPSDKAGVLGRLGHYEVREVIGRGGMGIVLKAFDENLHRVVAIKVMAPQLAASATARARFTREARAQAAVSHDHVVTIHAVEEAGGLPYIVMQCVAGQSLQDRLDKSGPLPVAEVLRIGMQAAAGLAAAHAQGLVHRDIKPANILLENGVERVKLTDFGLARAADDAGLTQSGQVAGTPQYMSPEQAEGKRLDARSDLFSLGSVLYAMCTGRPPFRAGSSIAVLKRVVEDTPTPVREANPEVPDWLADVIVKLHAKDPAGRFQTAAEVADLLGRHLAHVQHPSVAPLPSAAKGVTPPPRRQRRHRWAAAALALLALVAVLGVTEASGVTKLRAMVVRIFTPDGTLVVETDDPDVKIAVEGNGDLVITGAGVREVRLPPGSYKLRATKDGKTIREELVTISRGGVQVVKVSVESPAVPRAAAQTPLVPGEVRRLVGHGGIIYSVAVSPDGRHALSGGVDGTARLWDLNTGAEIRRFDARPPGANGPPGNAGEHPWAVTSVAFSRDGSQALIGTFGGPTRLWDVKTWQEKRRFGGHVNGLWSVAFSDDGCSALTAGGDRLACLWDLASGAKRRHFEEPQGGVWRAVFSPDQQRVLTASQHGTVRLWDAKTGEKLQSFETKAGSAVSIAFSPDGQRILSGDDHNQMRLWDVKTGRLLHQFPHGGWVWNVAFFRDGRRAVSGSHDRMVRLWDVETEQELARFDHGAKVWGTALCPDGRHVLSGGDDGVLRLWELPSTAAAAPKAEAGAFVLVGGKGVAERRFDTLAEAVGAAEHGDVIEVRGNGPFVTEPVKTTTALTIRAGIGFRPVVRLSAGSSEAQIMIEAHGPLILEGLEFQRLDSKPSQAGWHQVILASKALYAANCRFLTRNVDVHVAAPGTQRIELRNCEFLSSTTALVIHTLPGRALVLDNSVSTAGVFMGLRLGDPKGTVFRLTHNTFRSQPAVLTFQIRADEGDAKNFGETDWSVKALAVQASDNVFCADATFVFGQQSKSVLLPPGEAEALLPRMVGWQGNWNVHTGGGCFLGLRHVSAGTVALPPPKLPAGLAGWRKLWHTAEDGSVTGTVRFAGGDPLARAGSALETVTPDDFRLRPDSAGYRADPGGKDVGADVDLVGPGEAYERWKKAPDYQQWLKETGQIPK